ncbi:hypothetical protein [Limnohabitans sp. Rim8]|uniref:hypothetical protein n=1 Tax=Limnohabitans sp. Rim8 TaxID=1100718 RepID=UPI0033067AB7
MNAALGVRFFAGALAATFLAGAAFAVVTFFAGVFFAVAMLRFLCTEVGSKPETLIWSGDLHANGENHGFQVKKLFFTRNSHCCCCFCHADRAKVFTTSLPDQSKRYVAVIFFRKVGIKFCNVIILNAAPRQYFSI